MTEKTSKGKIIAAVGGALLIISLFLKWSGVDLGAAGDVAKELQSQYGGAAGAVPGLGDIDTSANAFDISGWIPFLYILIGLLAIAPMALDMLDLEIELPFEGSLVTLAGGVLALGGMLWVLDAPGSTKIGGWLALLASIAITAGGVMQIQEEGGDVQSSVRNAGTGATASPAAAQPAAEPAPPAAAPESPQPPASSPSQPPPGS